MRIDDDLKYFEEPEFKDILAKYEAAREAGTPMYMGADELTDVAEYYSLVMHDEDRASEAIELALEIHPSAVDPQVFLARRFMMQGDLDKAQEICNAIEEQANREVLFLHAELMLRRGNEKEAFSFLDRRIEEIDEDRDFFIYDSAYIFVDYHLYDLALTLANKLAEMAPDWYKTWQLQADVNLGLGNNRVALDYIEKMLDSPWHLRESLRKHGVCACHRASQRTGATAEGMGADAARQYVRSTPSVSTPGRDEP